jgi:hypothetical protein
VRKRKKLVLLVLVLVDVYLSARIIHPTNALYADSVSLLGVGVRIGDWLRPVSNVVGLFEDNQLEKITREDNFEVRYEANDGGVGVDYVELWYSHNQSDWQLFGSDQPNSLGSFQFNCPDDDGFYDFQTLAVDKRGNEEDKNFETNFKTVFVDTTPPVSDLSEDYILSADDGFGSGVLRIFYSANDGGEKIVWGNQVSISDDLPAGGNTVIFYSEDTAGNIEEKNTLSL